MGYFSDPTADMAIGNISREFSKYEKKAKKLCKLYWQGRLSQKELERQAAQFKGLYKNVLKNALTENEQKKTAE